jgi:hypothetical protein
VQDLSGGGFGGLLSRIAVHAVAGMGKTRGQQSKKIFARETEGALAPDLVGLIVYPRSGASVRTATRRRKGHTASMHTHAPHVPNSVGAARKNIVFHKNEFQTRTRFTKRDACVRARHGMVWRGGRGEEEECV